MTGSLQIKNGVYYVVLNQKDLNGKRKQKWICTQLDSKGNKRKATQMLNELLIQYEGIEYVEPSRVLLCDYIKEWVELNRVNIQKTTYDAYVHMVGTHIYPYFKEKNISLSKVKPIDIERYYAIKREYGLASNTLIKHHAIIRSALQDAVKNKYIKENIADLVTKPKHTKYTADFYDADQLKTLIKIIQGTRIEVPVIIACFYGLRRSEILGLKWSAIDFQQRQISICSKIVRAIDEEGKLISLAQNTLKSQASVRTLPLCDVMVNYLQNIQDRIKSNQSLMGKAYNHEYDDYICVDEMGNLLKPDYVTSKFKKILVSNDLKLIRFHDLRHSCATLLLSLGYTMKDIQLWLGHSDFNITANTYTHSDIFNRVKMINSVEQVFVEHQDE